MYFNRESHLSSHGCSAHVHQNICEIGHSKWPVLLNPCSKRFIYNPLVPEEDAVFIPSYLLSIHLLSSCSPPFCLCLHHPPFFVRLSFFVCFVALLLYLYLLLRLFVCGQVGQTVNVNTNENEEHAMVMPDHPCPFWTCKLNTHQ